MARVLTKKSTVAAKVPLATDLEIGELAVNTADAKLYTKHSDNTVKQLGIATNDSRLTDAREWTASTVTQSEAEAGTATTRRAWTAQRVFQGIAAWWAASAMKTKLDGIATGATANATDAQLRDRATHTGTQAISTVTGLQTALDGKLATSARGVANGVASLDANGLIPPMQLPSYVDDVLEYAATSNFPATGETGKIYIAINGATPENPTKQYRWTGTAYSEITSSPGSTDAVPEGSGNLYFTADRVRSTVLTGLSLASSAAVAATDTVLAAFGKIQARLNLLGTAANANVQTGPIDTTAGALMPVGAFGVGGSLGLPDANLPPMGGGFYDHIFLENSTTNTGYPRLGDGYNRHWNTIAFGPEHRKTEITSEVFGGATPRARTFIRVKHDANWSAWRELYTQASILGAVSQSGGVPTGAIIERGSNSNGEYIRYADGTQICHHHYAQVVVPGITGWGFANAASFSVLPTSIATYSADANTLVLRMGMENCRIDGATVYVHNTSTLNREVRVFFKSIGRWY